MFRDLPSTAVSRDSLPSSATAWCQGGANGGDARRRWSLHASRKSLKKQRPALTSAGPAGLRIESSTGELPKQHKGEPSPVPLSVGMLVNVRSVFGGCRPLLSTPVVRKSVRRGAIALTLHQ